METSNQAGISPQPAAPKPSKARKIVGAFLVAGPIIGLVFIFVAYALATFVITLTVGSGAAVGSAGSADLRSGVMSVVNVLLGFLGIICIIGILVGIPLGFYLMATTGNKKFSMKEAVNFGWQSMKKNFWLFVGIFLIVGVIQYFPAVLQMVIGEKNENALVVLFGLLVSIVFAILGAWAGLGLRSIGLKVVDSQPFKVSDLFPSVMNFIFFLLSSVLYALIIIGGLILLIIPGIIWAIKYSLYPYFILEGWGPVQALKASGSATKDAKAELFVFSFLLGLINLVGILALVVGLFATLPTTIVASAYVYRRLKAQANVVKPA